MFTSRVYSKSTRALLNSKSFFHCRWHLKQPWHWKNRNRMMKTMKFSFLKRRPELKLGFSFYRNLRTRTYQLELAAVRNNICFSRKVRCQHIGTIWSKLKVWSLFRLSWPVRVQYRTLDNFWPPLRIFHSLWKPNQSLARCSYPRETRERRRDTTIGTTSSREWNIIWNWKNGNYFTATRPKIRCS